MRLRPPASLPERLGRARGGRASPGAVVELPFRRSRPAPRGRFPRAFRVVALSSDLTGSRRRHCCRRRAADMTFVGGPHRKRAASRRRPSIDLRKDPRSIHPPGFIARPQPADIGALDPTPSPPTGWPGVWHGAQRGWFVTLFILKSYRSQWVGGAGYADNRRIVSTQIPSPIGRRCPVGADVGRPVGAAKPPPGGRPTPFRARTTASPSCAQALSQWERERVKAGTGRSK
jgi:hypothetical protein